MKTIYICNLLFFILPFSIVVANPFPQQANYDLPATNAVDSSSFSGDNAYFDNPDSGEPGQAETGSVSQVPTSDDAGSGKDWLTANSNTGDMTTVDSVQPIDNLVPQSDYLEAATPRGILDSKGYMCLHSNAICCNDGKGFEQEVRVDCDRAYLDCDNFKKIACCTSRVGEELVTKKFDSSYLKSIGWTKGGIALGCGHRLIQQQNGFNQLLPSQ